MPELMEEYEHVAHTPETLTQHNRMALDNSTGRAVWGVLLGQPEIWTVLVEFFDGLTRAKTLQEYITGIY